MTFYRNHYIHTDCEEQPGIEWTDTWDCMCNDHCPACDAEIEPWQSEELSHGQVVDVVQHCEKPG